MSAAVKIVAMPNGRFQENCYLLAEAGSADAVIIDPGEEVALFRRTAETEGLAIREIWLTHAHIDHVLGVSAIKAATGAPILLHPADEPIYRDLPRQGMLFGVAAEPAPPVDRLLAHGDVLTLGTIRFEVRHVPGHSPGSVCFVTPGLVIAGDVLFQGSIGRTDLPGGNTEQLLRGIREQLLTLPDETAVYPGHGPATTIGAERRRNPFLVGVG